MRITSTDVTTANSAEAYASIASYVANQDRVLGSPASVDEVVNQVSPLFLEQNHGDQSTEALFHDYLSKGAGPTAMVMIPEAQFVARAAARDGSIRPNMVLMYPDPDVLSKYTLVPLSSAGDTVGRLLTDDPTLQQLAVEHGFRITSKPEAFDSFAKQNKIAVQPQVPDAIEPPDRRHPRALDDPDRRRAARDARSPPGADGVSRMSFPTFPRRPRNPHDRGANDHEPAH